jgi:hypothetical protein
MTPEQIKAMQEENAKLKADLIKKDEIIEQKSKDVVGARKEYKRLADMTEAEKQALSAKELELQERQEAHEKEIEDFKKSQAETAAKEKQARVDRAIKAIAGTDTKYAEKLNNNLGRIKDFDAATTEEEINKVVNDGANMLGEPRPNAIQGALNADGSVANPKPTEGNGFSETPEGKGLAEAMNLPKAPEAPAAPTK